VVLGLTKDENNAGIEGPSAQIPYSEEQGISLAEHGILAREQGGSSAGTEGIVDEIFDAKGPG
jgi:hypothetical protein